MAFSLSAAPFDRDVVFDFFWRFSAFECALKREGFLRSGHHENAEPDWDRFGQEVRGRFDHVTTPHFHSAVESLQQLAPRRQKVRDGRLVWELVRPSQGQSDEAFVLRLLRTVRNNLFHGGKYPDGPIDEIARDTAIIRAACTVLEGCYEVHAGVRRRIDDSA